MLVSIDPAAGFCFGVDRAIGLAESALDQDMALLCLGEIVHNDQEIIRLRAKGMETINETQLRDLKNKKVLVRAHGEPPAVWNQAERNNLAMIDGTCPIVSKLQHKVALADQEIRKSGGMVIIFGKAEHPEVRGLLGHIRGMAKVVSDPSEIKSLPCNVPIRLFAQTTMDPGGWETLREAVEAHLKAGSSENGIDFKAYRTICGQVSGRAPKLRKFAGDNDVMVFVSGKNSSNGKVLFNVCREANARSFWISEPGELKDEWFENVNTVGISGATSTPGWLLEQVAEKIMKA